MDKMIPVTRPALAPLSEFSQMLESVWESGIMTHNGPLLQRLEKNLAELLNVPDVVCVANGTVALQLAIRALDLKGEVITTPFSFIATSNIIEWEKCEPVFVDVDPNTWNLDVEKVKRAITSRTSAIMPVHVFSRPCEVEELDHLAKQHGLKVIYDAAHAFGVNRQDKSLMLFGDISCLSFHATKLFNTGEGGACITKDSEVAKRLRRLRFFGFDESKEVVDAGMNGKMSEIHAALGLCNLPYVPEVKAHRHTFYNLYRNQLGDLPGIQFQSFDANEYNYSYMPVVFPSREICTRVEKALLEVKITPRRYFYPSLNTLKIYQVAHQLPVSESLASRILCLPLYFNMTEPDLIRICNIIKRAFA